MEQFYEEISDFLKKKPSHIFSEIISGVIDCSSSGHPVLIIDTKNNLKLWSRAISACFPEKAISSLEFHELSLDRKGNKLLVIQPSAKEGEELCTNVFARTFDFKKNQYCKLGRSYKYARFAEYGMLSSTGMMDSMRELLSRFSYTCIGEDIDSYSELFLLISDHQKEPDYDGVRKALDFINSYGDSAAMQEIYAPFQTYLSGLMNSTDKEQLKAVASFGVKALKSLGESITLESAASILFECFDDMLSEDTGYTASECYHMFSTLLLWEEALKSQLFEFSVSKDRLETMDSLMRKCPNGERAAFYMRLIEEALGILGYSWKKGEKLPRMKTLIDSCSCTLTQNVHGISFVTRGLKGDIGTGIMLELLNRADSKEAMNQLVEGYICYMDSLTAEEQMEARRKLCSLGGARIVYEEFLRRLEAADRKQEFFEKWTAELFSSSEEFAQSYYSPVIMEYLKNFKSPRKRYEQCERLLEELLDKEQYLDLVSCQMLVNGIENGLPLDSTMGGKRRLIEYVRKLKGEFGIKTVPDMLFFADFGMWLEETGGGGYSLGTILEGMPSIMFLHGDRLRHFQDWCVPMLIPLVRTPEDHRSLVYAFRAGEHIHEFSERYMKFVCEFLEKDKLNGYNVFLQFVVYFFYYLKAEYKLSDGKTSIQNAGELLREAIYSQPAIFRKKLDIDVRRELRARRLKVPVLWVDIIKQRSYVPQKRFMDRLKGSLAKACRKK